MPCLLLVYILHFEQRDIEKPCMFKFSCAKLYDANKHETWPASSSTSATEVKYEYELRTSNLCSLFEWHYSLYCVAFILFHEKESW